MNWVIALQCAQIIALVLTLVGAIMIFGEWRAAFQVQRQATRARALTEISKDGPLPGLEAADNELTAMQYELLSWRQRMKLANWGAYILFFGIFLQIIVATIQLTQLFCPASVASSIAMTSPSAPYS